MTSTNDTGNVKVAEGELVTSLFKSEEQRVARYALVKTAFLKLQRAISDAEADKNAVVVSSDMLMAAKRVLAVMQVEMDVMVVVAGVADETNKVK